MAILSSNPVVENRIGCFLIDHKYMEKDPNLIMRIMGRCIVIETKNHFYNNTVEYIAYSPEFEPTSSIDGPYISNHYNIEVKEDEEGRKLFKFIKQESESTMKKLRSITY